MPIKLYGASVVALQKSIYTFGSNSAGRWIKDIQKYQMRANSWEVLKHCLLPQAGAWLQSQETSHKAVCIFCTNASGEYLRDTLLFDFNSVCVHGHKPNMRSYCNYDSRVHEENVYIFCSSSVQLYCYSLKCAEWTIIWLHFNIFN